MKRVMGWMMVAQVSVFSTNEWTVHLKVVKTGTRVVLSGQGHTHTPGLESNPSTTWQSLPTHTAREAQKLKDKNKKETVTQTPKDVTLIPPLGISSPLYSRYILLTSNNSSRYHFSAVFPDNILRWVHSPMLPKLQLGANHNTSMHQDVFLPC